MNAWHACMVLDTSQPDLKKLVFLAACEGGNKRDRQAHGRSIPSESHPSVPDD